MAEKEKSEKLFDEINTLYDEYVSLSGVENVESIFLSVKEKILIAIYNVYVNIPKTAKKEDVNYNSYADEIVKISVKCLKQFGKSKSASKIPFSQYVCFSIKRKLNYLKEKEELEQKNGGMEISDSDFKKAWKVKKLDTQYLRYGSKDEEIRNNKIADAMEISVSEVEDLKEIWKRYTISMIQFDEDGNEFEITDQKQADEFKNGNFPSPENIFLRNEKINSILSIVKAELKEHYGDTSEKSLLFKTILTVDLLRKHFPQKLADKKDDKDSDKDDKDSDKDDKAKKEKARKKIEEESSYYFNLEKLFRDAGFFDPKILEPLFSDENYCLPEMQSLAEQVDLSKSGLSKKLTRFYEKVVERYEDTYFPKEDYDAEKDSVIKDSVMRGVRKFLGLKSDNYSENRQDASLYRENELSK